MAIQRLAAWLLRLFSDAYLVLRFASNRVGKENGITHIQKLRLAMTFARNVNRIKALSTWQQHLLLAEELFRVPKSVQGDVVEAGCYSGASTANLSLACELVDRKLFVCDSFEGLPEPREDEKYTTIADRDEYYRWQAGEFAPGGGIDIVKDTVAKYGSVAVCEFVEGYFEDTLKNIETDSLVLIFEDADLVSSVEDCLRYLWPKLHDRCIFFSHEPFSFDVVALFFDKQWWHANLKSHPPGFVGSGNGARVRGLGYARKLSREDIYEHGSRVAHLGSKGFEER